MPPDKKLKILIVDDDNFLLDMYSLKFAENGFEVIPSLSSDDALLKLRGGLKPEVILLDILMPKIDGFEFLKVLEEEKLGLDATRIILSNLGQPSDMESGKKLGVAGYIVKASATPSEVVSKVKEILSAFKK